MKLCADRDNAYSEMMRALVTEVIAEGPNRTIDPEMVVNGIDAMVQGLWLDILLNPKNVDRKQALNTCFLFLNGLFPEQLTPDGAIKSSPA